MSQPVYIIAEAGVNHNGDLAMARKLIDLAAGAGADAVKFQTFRPQELATESAEKAAYQKATTGREQSQLEMLKQLALSCEDHFELLDYCKKTGIQFLSTAFDLPSADFLHSMQLPAWKIASGEITNVPLVERIGSFRPQKIFLSTGMADLGEIEHCIQILEEAGIAREKITLLHCTTDYPARMEDVNLKAMISLREAFGCSVGYSDHTPGVEVSIAAVALGARVIEKHFTLDKSLPGPDHAASLDPDALVHLIRCIRNIEVALGDGIKRPTPIELENKKVVRKSIFAARDVSEGEEFSESNLTCKRPETGIPSSRWKEILGKRAGRSYRRDEPIDP